MEDSEENVESFGIKRVGEREKTRFKKELIMTTEVVYCVYVI